MHAIPHNQALTYDLFRSLNRVYKCSVTITNTTGVVNIGGKQNIGGGI